MSSHLPVTIITSMTTSYPGPAQVTAGFTPNSWCFICESHADEIRISFNGTDDHLVIKPGRPQEAITINCDDTDVWFRRSSGSASADDRIIVMAVG